ncbi:MAG: von Willebrand factor type A domain-containing protein [candidate division Zixibacteria bacterium]|nr:von Willebrand factor type A domain-containing protein [candidate division Zixibacteria bacterium]
MKRKSLTALVLAGIISFALVLPVSAGEVGSIDGQVVNVNTGQPVKDASIVIESANIATLSNFAGNFTFDNLKPGRYTMVVTHPDFQTEKRADIEVVAGWTTSLVIALTPGEAKKSEAEIFDRLDEQLPHEAVGREEKMRISKESLNYLTPREAPSVSTGGAVDNNYKNVQQSIVLRQRIDRCPPTDYDIPRGPFDMFFRDYGTSGFVNTEDDRLSTFAVDVDDASYVLVRRYLQEGYMPPTDAIRVEEFINHFDYAYNPPDHQKFRVFTEWATSPFDRNTVIIKIGVKGSEILKRERRPLNLTLVVDVSGSMGYDNRMELVKESLRLLVRQLNRHDRVGMVTYGTSAQVVMEPVSADRTDIILRAIDCLRPGGSTFAEAGIRLGYKMAHSLFDREYNNSLILLSDGVANVGSTMPEDIMRKVKQFTKEGITLSAYGFGMGNYNDVLLEQLAQQGNGKYAYVNDRTEARKVFVEDFVGNFQILARDVKIQVEFDPRRVLAYRLLGYENRDVPDHKFRDNRQDGGEIGAGHEVTALYELVLADKQAKGRGSMGTVSVRWKDPDQTEVTELSKDIELSGRVGSFERSRPEYRLAVVAGKFAELLKGTEYSYDFGYRDLYIAAASLVEDLPGDQTRELLDLIRLAGGFREELSRR